MKIRAISSSLLLGAFSIIGCASSYDDAPGGLDDDDALGSFEQSIAKGRPGATIGSNDYCNNPASPCTLGEGDCDSNAQCSGGSVCIADNGPKFGFPQGWDVCAATHCSNRIMDGDETATDCGGSCGVCAAVCAGTPGGANFCSGCACASGQGDCDSNADCANGLSCGVDNGPRFGLPLGYDVCVPSHCTNQVLDAADGETGVDEGGDCGPSGACSGTLGSTTFCQGCKCSLGQGDCDSNLECANGLSCGTDNGPKFNMPAGHDVCVPPHCTNKVLDAADGETGIDIGGACDASCGNGIVNTGEVCDDGINDGVVCGVNCLSQPTVAQILVDCADGSGVGSNLAGAGCLAVGGGASYIKFLTSGISVTLYSGGDCTGQTRTVTSDINFCFEPFDQGGGLNDNVHSATIQHL
jgi:hypothetical protein